MRSSKSRSRNKSNRQRSLGNVVNRVFDSSGPEGKVRGTPQQIIEKYLTLARDAQLSGDRVAEQSFLQHAEHYTRMLGEAQKEMAERQQFHQPRQDDDGREAQPNGNGGQQHRDQGGREQGSRDDGGRDHGNGRDQARREHGGRDNGGRDNIGRDNGHQGQQRDHVSRDQGGNRDQGHREQPRLEPLVEEQPEFQPEAPAARPVPAPQEPSQPDPVMDPDAKGLPDPVTTSDDEGAGLVETPEAAARPARARAPRAPRGDKPAAPRPRARRKPAEDGGENKPQASEE
ncbi:DUF4167 domain-containing protein [Paracoccus sp. AK26]|uniref:DUF4167 domain-containing protein n=1 Tax=Paracoccus sp. AK26 TaxID=2589076 RepID=UPI00142828F1|nr:DUF4167 domain-containing protein [Paracoccus sp. AK26]QIR86032.1 DUF4167 domain-containing protein [Paracoccus sp. AK26]